MFQNLLQSGGIELQLNENFSRSIANLHSSLEALMSSEPFQFENKPADLPESAVYLFCEDNQPLYVGRTNKLKQRLAMHCRPSTSHNQAAFAFKLARKTFGISERSYHGANTRKDLISQPEFIRHFCDAKSRLRAMDIRYVEEADQLKQTLLEIYCAVALDTPYNEFGTH